MKKVIIASLLLSSAVVAAPHRERLTTEQANGSVLEQIIGADLDVRSQSRTEVTTREERASFVSQGLGEAVNGYISMQPATAIGSVEKLWQPTIRVGIEGGEDHLMGKVGAWVPFAIGENESVDVDGVSLTRAAKSLAYVDVEGRVLWLDDDITRDGEDEVFEASVGVGYRSLVGNTSRQKGVIVGANLFIDGIFDDEDEDFLAQASLGLEARAKHMSAYANGYVPFEEYGGEGNSVEGNCLPRLGVDGGISAHVPFGNRDMSPNDYAELEFYGQGFLFTDYDNVEEVYGGILGVGLTYESDMGGSLPYHTSIEPFAEAIWVDGEGSGDDDEADFRGGVQLSFPLANPTGLQQGTEVDPRYHRRMRGDVKRNLGAGFGC